MTPQDPEPEPPNPTELPTPSQIATGGGLANTGEINTGGGAVIGRDQIIHQHGFNADEVAQIIETVRRVDSPTTQVPTARARLPFEPDVVLIPAGTFWLGSDDGAMEQRPRHAVALPAYAICQQPITNAQYAAFVQQEAEYRPRGAGWRFTTPPADQLAQAVTGIRWSDAVAYCAWLTAQSGRHYRLPSEAEWEKASQLGIISAEIREWTTTIWGDDPSAATFIYPYQADGRDSLTVQGVYRIWRGGSPNPVQPSRGFASPSSRLPDLGLRVVSE